MGFISDRVVKLRFISQGCLRCYYGAAHLFTRVNLHSTLRLRPTFYPLLAIVLFVAACTKSDKPAAPLDPITRGQSVYLANCAACHNANPKLDGSVGPAVFGSSLELITARVLKATYPDGYKPKRATGQMPAFPHLEKELQPLYQFLNSDSQ